MRIMIIHFTAMVVYKKRCKVEYLIHMKHVRQE